MGRRLLLGVLFGVVLYAGILLWADQEDLTLSLSSIPWWTVPAAMALSFANYLIRFWKWEYYRGLLAIRVPRGTSLVIYLSGLSMGVTPGKMGEVLKSWMLRKVSGVRIHESAPIVVAERITDLLGYLILVAIGGLATQPELQWAFWATLLVCVAAIALVGSRRVARWTTAVLLRLPVVHRLAPRVERSFETTRVLLAPRRVLWPTAISVVSWGCECAGFWILADAFLPGSISPLFAVFAYATSAVIGALAIVLPGGLGATEWSLGTLLRRRYEDVGGVTLDLARSKAVGVVLLARLATLWFGVFVGLVAVAIFQRRHGKVEIE